MDQYNQSQEVLWKVSVIQQDYFGNEHEFAVKVLATSISEALKSAEKRLTDMELNEKWMIYDIGIMPENCFN